MNAIRYFSLASVAVATALLAACSNDEQDVSSTMAPYATAQLRPTAGHQTSGRVMFMKSVNDDSIRMIVELQSLNAGPHGFHIHENGDCSASDASSAGGHFNPDVMPHGSRNDEQRHVGDLGNIVADENGIATLDIEDTQIAFGGEDSILGKSVIVHSGADDYSSQPAGNAGERIACGVITLAEPVAPLVNATSAG